MTFRNVWSFSYNLPKWSQLPWPANDNWGQFRTTTYRQNHRQPCEGMNLRCHTLQVLFLFFHHLTRTYSSLHSYCVSDNSCLVGGNDVILYHHKTFSFNAIHSCLSRSKLSVEHIFFTWAWMWDWMVQVCLMCLIPRLWVQELHINSALCPIKWNGNNVGSNVHTKFLQLGNDNSLICDIL